MGHGFRSYLEIPEGIPRACVVIAVMIMMMMMMMMMINFNVIIITTV